MSSVDTIADQWRDGRSYEEILRAMSNSDLTQVLIHAAELRSGDYEYAPLNTQQLSTLITLTEAEILCRMGKSDGVYTIFDTLSDPRYDQPIFQCATQAEVDEWMDDVHPGFRSQYTVYAPGESPQQGMRA